MAARAGRHLVAMFACLLWLAGCETPSQLSELSAPGSAQTASPDDDPATTGALPPAADDANAQQANNGSHGAKANDDVALGRKYYGAGHFGLARRHFRRAAELHPNDLDAWVGLGAVYDRLRRFALADRAYDQAMRISGPTAQLLNNRGYSYILRGDFRRARETLDEARAKEPTNPYVKSNLELLESSVHKRKSAANNPR
jgi:Flp pilus assembly protein TadD